MTLYLTVSLKAERKQRESKKRLKIGDYFGNTSRNLQYMVVG